MRGYSKTFILGNIGRDPEIKSTTTGKLLASFSVGVNEIKDKPTEWFSCTAWEKTAEIVRDYAKKGSMVFIEARKQTRSWDGENGKQYRDEFHVLSLSLVGGIDREEKQPETKRSIKNQHNVEITDDDIPF